MAETEVPFPGLYLLDTLAYRRLLRRVFPLGPEKWFVKAARWLLYDGFGLERQKTSPAEMEFPVSTDEILRICTEGQVIFNGIGKTPR